MATAGFDPNDPGFQAIVAMFVAELPERVEAVRRALDESDQQSLRRIGHQLKGAAGCYGFDQLTLPAANLQSACDEGLDEEKVAEAANQLMQACRVAVESHGPLGSPA